MGSEVILQGGHWLQIADLILSRMRLRILDRWPLGWLHDKKIFNKVDKLGRNIGLDQSLPKRCR